MLLEWSSEVQTFLFAEDMTDDDRNDSWPPDDGKQLDDIVKYELTMDEIVEGFLRSLNSPTTANDSFVDCVLKDTVENKNGDLNRLQEENDAMRRELSEKNRIIEALQAELRLKSPGSS